MGGYPDDWEGKTLVELANEDGTYGKNHSTKDEVELFMYTMRSAFSSVQNEMFKQVAKWGVQEHLSFRINAAQVITPIAADANNWIPSEDDAKRLCEVRHAQGNGTWADILLEELAEALGAAYKNQDPTGYSIAYPGGTPEAFPEDPEEAKKLAESILASGADDVYYEVLQTAAVACAWLTAILVGRNREVIVKEMEQVRQEQELKAKWFRDLQQKAQLLMGGGAEFTDKALEQRDEDEFTPGGYI